MEKIKRRTFYIPVELMDGRIWDEEQMVESGRDEKERNYFKARALFLKFIRDLSIKIKRDWYGRDQEWYRYEVDLESVDRTIVNYEWGSKFAKERGMDDLYGFSEGALTVLREVYWGAREN